MKAKAIRHVLPIVGLVLGSCSDGSSRRADVTTDPSRNGETFPFQVVKAGNPQKPALPDGTSPPPKALPLTVSVRGSTAEGIAAARVRIIGLRLSSSTSALTYERAFEVSKAVDVLDPMRATKIIDEASGPGIIFDTVHLLLDPQKPFDFENLDGSPHSVELDRLGNEISLVASLSASPEIPSPDERAAKGQRFEMHVDLSTRLQREDAKRDRSRIQRIQSLLFESSFGRVRGSGVPADWNLLCINPIPALPRQPDPQSRAECLVRWHRDIVQRSFLLGGFLPGRYRIFIFSQDGLQHAQEIYVGAGQFTTLQFD